ncbi:MAG: GNAT family N-acetyltransferase [Candidatus Bathyarchaeia archaeon]
MRILKETSGPQTIYKLRDDELDEALGEAVVSEIKNEFRLHGIFVKPRFRGKGYGKLIMNAVLREAQTKRVTLCTGLGNVTFFKRFGFEIIDIGDSLVSMEKKPVNDKFLSS